jgi:DNA-binding CsgD family transcriptional regulator
LARSDASRLLRSAVSERVGRREGLNGEIRAQRVDFCLKSTGCGTPGVEGLELSRRQKQVLPLVAEGLTDEEIGRRLGISPRTARAHVDALKHKLDVTRRREVPAAYYHRTGEDPFATSG